MSHNYTPLGWCLLTLCVLVPVRPLAVSQTYCVAGNFTEGESANITCFFTQDINATRRNFNVVRHPLNSPTDSGNGIYVILCNWATGKSLECTGKQEYVLNSTVVTNNVTLMTSRVQKEMEGSYFCQEVPGNGQPTKPCSLYVTDHASSLSSSLAVVTVTSQTAAKVGTTAATSSSQGESSTFIAVLVMCLLFVIISLCLAAALVYIRLSFRLQRKHVPSTRATRFESVWCCIKHDGHTICNSSGVPDFVEPSIQSSSSSQARRNDQATQSGGLSNENGTAADEDSEGAALQSKNVASRENFEQSGISREETTMETTHLTAGNSDNDCTLSDEDEVKTYIEDYNF